jgi:hypothetical protein
MGIIKDFRISLPQIHRLYLTAKAQRRRKVRYEKIIQFSNFIATDLQIIFNRKGAKKAQSSLRKDYSIFKFHCHRFADYI